eukprot:COSAG01_NODE_69645_length_260_cov_21.819876_1_plen_52_part_10
MRLPFCVIDKKIDFRHTTGAYLKPPTGNLGTRTAIRTTVRPQLAHGRDSQSR